MVALQLATSAATAHLEGQVEEAVHEDADIAHLGEQVEEAVHETADTAHLEGQVKEAVHEAADAVHLRVETEEALHKDQHHHPEGGVGVDGQGEGHRRGAVPGPLSPPPVHRECSAALVNDQLTDKKIIFLAERALLLNKDHTTSHIISVMIVTAH